MEEEQRPRERPRDRVHVGVVVARHRSTARDGESIATADRSGCLGLTLFLSRDDVVFRGHAPPSSLRSPARKTRLAMDTRV